MGEIPILLFLFILSLVLFFVKSLINTFDSKYLFRVNGERFSGTNFLFQLLKKNNFPVIQNQYKWSLFPFGKIVSFWKHSVPKRDIKNKKIIIDIFIFRDLNQWLKSMWKNNHVTHEKYDIFLRKKLDIKRGGLGQYNINNEHLYIDDIDKSIFELRYFKFKKILEFKKYNKNVIFINLAYLQNKKNANDFIIELAGKYKIKLNSKVISEICRHTKTCKLNSKNTIIEAPDNTSYINSQKNVEIENYIDTLEYKFFNISP